MEVLGNLEKRLYDAAATGDTKTLHDLLESDPLPLDRVSFTCPNKPPLHVATIRGHLSFVQEILKFNPQLAEQLDFQQTSPLHIASTKGDLDIVKELISVAPGMCFSRDFQGRNPLHVAAIEGHVKVLEELIQRAPLAAREKVDRGQTALHLCAKHQHFEAFIEPDLRTAQIKIINKFNPFTGFQSPTYILKSRKKLTVEEIKAVLLEGHEECTEQIYDIYLLPPGEDSETCQSYLRMRNKDGKYNLMFEEWVTDFPFVISPRITFEVSVRLLGGLMALGYTIATILKRSSHVLSDERVCVKIDWLEQLNRHYVQVQPLLQFL